MLTWNKVLKLASEGNLDPDKRVVKTKSEWRQKLNDEEYWVTREGGTERAFSSELCSIFEPGIYACLCCDTLLFDASQKFDSKTGWPSFSQPIKQNAIAYHLDSGLGMTRIETTCNICDAHLGHVFSDGPSESGLRYCMNAIALHKK